MKLNRKEIMKHKKTGSLVAALLGIAILLSGCGASENSNSNNADDKTQIVHIGVGNVAPLDYVNENGELDGYEVKVLQAADDILPNYKFKIQSYDWANLFASLDSGKTTAAAFGLTLNTERKQKYDYTDAPYLAFENRLIVSKKSKVKSLDDLKGKKVFASQGEAVALSLSKRNEAEPDKAIELNYGNQSLEQIVASLDNGSIDAYYGTPILLNSLNENYGNKLKFVGKPLLVNNIHIFIKKGNTEFKKELDKALEKLKKNGTLSKLSKQYLGDDYSEELSDSGELKQYQ